MRYLSLCALLLLAGCENGYSSYPYYSNGMPPPPPPGYGYGYGAPQPPPPPGYANCGTPDLFKPCPSPQAPQYRPATY